MSHSCEAPEQSTGGRILLNARAPDLASGSHLVLDVLCYASYRGFCREQIARTIDRNPLSHCSIGRIGFVRRHEDCYFAVLQTPDANALEPVRMPLWIRFRVCRINCVVSVYRESAHAAELAPFTEILPLLRQDLNSMVVAIGNNQASLGVELDRMRSSELPRTHSGLTDHAQELAVAVEDRDPAHQIGIVDVRVALRDVNIAVVRVGDDVVRLGQRIGRIALHAGFSQGHQYLA